MNVVGEIAYSFFHNEIVIGIMIAALIGSIASFSKFLVSRKEKNRDKQEKSALTLFTLTGLLLIMGLFYGMSFFDLGFTTLNVTCAGSFLLLVIVGIISFVDKFRERQKTLDYFIDS